MVWNCGIVARIMATQSDTATKLLGYKSLHSIIDCFLLVRDMSLCPLFSGRKSQCFYQLLTARDVFHSGEK